MKARPYQADCITKVLHRLLDLGEESTLAVLATGLGKTVILSHIAEKWKDGRVLVLAHRKELIEQAAQKLEAITGETPEVEMGASRASGFRLSKIVVASVQTLYREGRRNHFRPDEFGLIITDEAHHAVASTYRSVFDYFASAKRLGVTATPRRADELALGQVFGSVAYDYGIEPAIEDGWLVPVDQQAIRVDGLDFSKVRSVAGDLSESDLESILVQEKILHETAAPTVDVAKGRSGLVFCVSVSHAEQLAAVLDRYRKGCAAVLSGKDTPERRSEVVAAYKAGDVQFLCNCMLFLEGFDAPNTELVVMARPTKSLTLYTQVVGRGTRPLPGIVDPHEAPEARREAIRTSKKPSMLVLDFVGNSGRHKIITALDLLGGKYEAPVIAEARKNLESEGVRASVEESLERAAEEVAFLKDFEAIRRRITAQAKYRTDFVSPFAPGYEGHKAETAPRGGATDKQINYLVYLGVPREKAAGYSKSQAGKVIDSMKKRQEASV